MRLEWLEDILAVIETGSFSEAAERRRLTQSAFSRRIRLIEQYVGLELFDRSRKPVQLRPTLQDQRDQIVRLAGLLRQLTEDLRHGERIMGNRIVLASQHALTTSLTPALLRRMETAHPAIHVRLRSANLDECYSLLLSRSADIALVYYPANDGIPPHQDYIESARVGTDRLIPVAHPTLAATIGSQDPRRLVPLIAYPADVFLGRLLNRAILPRAQATGRFVPKVETALTLAALELATEALGVAWVPASLAHRAVAARRVLDLSDRLPACDLGVAAIRIRGTRTVAEKAMWATLTSAAAHA